MTTTAGINGAAASFEELYLSLRDSESRIYNDAMVAALPQVPATHPHAAEWKIRQRSSRLLVQYLLDKKADADILEIGCGNGWLCNRIAQHSAGYTTGVDINHVELEQAQRVFAETPRLQFVAGDILDGVLDGQRYDAIIFASSIQYFPVPEIILDAALELLQPGGAIHIIDSPFYRHDEVLPARMRSSTYFREMGHPGMIDRYFHHELNALDRYHYKILYNPGTLLSKLSGNRNPFYWIRIDGKKSTAL